jgi:dienelactone hydrolase
MNETRRDGPDNRTETLTPLRQPGDPVRLSLPAPTGEHPVGTTSLHVVDGSRTDPLAPTPRARELMVRLWYPAARSCAHLISRYMPTTQAGLLTAQLNDLLGTGYPADLLTFPTHGRTDAPAASGPRRPVLLFSPALNTNAALYTTIFEELASRGYIVAAMEHTFDAAVVEFPDGRVEFQHPDAVPGSPVVRAMRVADARIVLDRVAGLTTGHHLGRAIDPTRVGAFGHSQGSLATVDAVETDPRLDSGLVLDGNPLGPAILDRPFMMFGRPTHRRAEDPDWAGFYDRLLGRPRRHLVVDGTGHHDFSDITIFKHRIDFGAIFAVGPIDGERSSTILRRYVTAWFDHTLRGRHNPLLRGESPHFPEVDFQR